MSGIKRSNVMASINSYSTSYDNELAVLKTTTKRKWPTLKATRLNLDDKLIKQYFAEELAALERKKASYIESYNTRVKRYNALCVELNSIVTQPKRLLAELTTLRNNIEASGRYHGMDKEHQQAQQLGGKINAWRTKVRALSNEIITVQSGSATLAQIPELYAECDNKLHALADKAKAQQTQEQMLQQKEQLRDEAKVLATSVDLDFMQTFQSKVHEQFCTMQKVLFDDTSSLSAMKKALGQLNKITVVSRNLQDDYNTRAKQQTKQLKALNTDINSSLVFDELSNENITMQAFYQQHDVGKVAEINSAIAMIKQTMAEVSNFQFDVVQEKIEKLQITVEKIKANSRDDSTKVSNIIEMALGIREKLLESGVMGKEHINTTLDNMLQNGLRIESVAHNNAYFDIAPDGTLAANVDDIAANCVQGMGDIAAALSQQGITLCPKNYSIAEQNNRPTASATRDTLKKI